MTGDNFVDAYPAIRAFIRRRVSKIHRDAVDDLVQETMLAVCIALSRHPETVPMDVIRYTTCARAIAPSAAGSRTSPRHA